VTNAPPGASTRLTSAARNASCRLITSPNAPSLNGSRPPGPSGEVLSGGLSFCTTGMPSGRSRAAATGTFGAQASVATTLTGRDPGRDPGPDPGLGPSSGNSRDSTSPPPVPISSMAAPEPAEPPEPA
jgi:hypothetical protein